MCNDVRPAAPGGVAVAGSPSGYIRTGSAMDARWKATESARGSTTRGGGGGVTWVHSVVLGTIVGGGGTA